MNIHWLVLSMISVVALSVANLLQRKLMREEGSHVVANSIVFQLFCAVLIAAVTAFVGFSIPPLKEFWINFLLMALLYAAGTLFLFRSLQTVEVSEATIIVASRALWTVAVAVFFLGEQMNTERAIGILLIFGAIVLVSYKSGEFKLSKGIWFLLAAATCYGLAVANDSYILRYYKDTLTFTTIAFLLPGFAMVIFRPSAIPWVVALIRSREMVTMAIMSVFYSGSAIAFYLAFRYGGAASQISPVQQSDVILTVILAAIFMSERGELPKKVVGALVTVAGVYLLR